MVHVNYFFHLSLIDLEKEVVKKSSFLMLNDWTSKRPFENLYSSEKLHLGPSVDMRGILLFQPPFSILLTDRGIF